jgi:hypothetical protein
LLFTEAVFVASRSVDGLTISLWVDQENTTNMQLAYSETFSLTDALIQGTKPFTPSIDLYLSNAVETFYNSTTWTVGVSMRVTDTIFKVIVFSGKYFSKIFSKTDTFPADENATALIIRNVIESPQDNIPVGLPVIIPFKARAAGIITFLLAYPFQKSIGEWIVAVWRVSQSYILEDYTEFIGVRAITEFKVSLVEYGTQCIRRCYSVLMQHRPRRVYSHGSLSKFIEFLCAIAGVRGC